MFGGLKKRLKEALDKVTKDIKKEEPKQGIEEEIAAKVEKEEQPIIEEKIQQKPEETAKAEKDEWDTPVISEEEAEIKEIEEIAEKDKEEVKEEERKIKSIINKEELRADVIVEEKEPKAIPIPKEKKGLFKKIFEKTLDKGDIDVILKELRFALLENDVSLDVVERISDDVSNELSSKSVRRDKIEDSVKEALRHAMLDVMSQDKIDLERLIKGKDGVFTIMFLGFNGTGKTTTVSKFAKKFKKYSPIVAAADTFRAASIEQLEEHGRRVGFRVVKHQYGADAAAVIFDARKAAIATGSKLVIADTAGRSHSNVNLMDELKKLVRVNNPDLKILVLDAVTGNDIYEQSKLFNDAVGVDAIILTKTDVYDKGGAALSATYTIKKPILYLGVGQEYDDLKEFNPEEIVDGLLK